MFCVVSLLVELVVIKDHDIRGTVNDFLVVASLYVTMVLGRVVKKAPNRVRASKAVNPIER